MYEDRLLDTRVKRWNLYAHPPPPFANKLNRSHCHAGGIKPCLLIIIKSRNRAPGGKAQRGTNHQAGRKIDVPAGNERAGAGGMVQGLAAVRGGKASVKFN